MTARLHNGPFQTNVIISDYVCLCVKYDGNPEARQAFKRKFGPRRMFLCIQQCDAGASERVKLLSDDVIMAAVQFGAITKQNGNWRRSNVCHYPTNTSGVCWTSGLKR